MTGYLEAAGLMAPLETLGFALAATAARPASATPGRSTSRSPSAIEENDLVVAAVLSGNRNFEGRIHPLARASYLASPPLVVAFALAGRVDIDLTREPLGRARMGAGDARGHLAVARRDPRDHRRFDRPGALPADVRDGFRRRRSLAGAADPVRRSLRLGRRLDLYRQAALLRRPDGRPAAGPRHRRAPGSWRSLATRSPPTTSRRPAPSRRGRRPGSGSRLAASPLSTSTRTGPAAATTKS